MIAETITAAGFRVFNAVCGAGHYSGILQHAARVLWRLHRKWKLRAMY